MDRRLTAPPVMLANGAWAFPGPDGVWIGLLAGDFEHGWRARFGQIPVAEFPAVSRCINTGGTCHGKQVSIDGYDRQVSIRLEDGPPAVLDESGGARLQLRCSTATHPLRRLRSGPQDFVLPVLRVGSDRACLDVLGPQPVVGQPVLTMVVADTDATVRVHADDDAGPLTLSLPALALLVAATEATRDGEDIRLTLHDPDRRATTLSLPSLSTGQVAADAQWLLPAFFRPVGGESPHSLR